MSGSGPGNFPGVWSIRLDVPPQALSAFEAAMERTCEALSSFEGRPGGPWRLEGITPQEPDHDALQGVIEVAATASGLAHAPSFSVLFLDDRDWVSQSQRGFPPVHAGRYFIYGSHHDGALPPGRVPVRIDAGQAFGTGRHESTLGCLLALDRLARWKKVRRPLDIGCGSGVLSLAVARTWRVGVLGCDRDGIAVKVAGQNARDNGLAAFLTYRVADGFNHNAIRRKGHFDLILVNILARPIVAMSPQIARYLEPGGVAILSGLLEREVPQVLCAIRTQGLALKEHVNLGGWATLVVQKGRRTC